MLNSILTHIGAAALGGVATFVCRDGIDESLGNRVVRLRGDGTAEVTASDGHVSVSGRDEGRLRSGFPLTVKARKVRRTEEREKREAEEKSKADSDPATPSNPEPSPTQQDFESAGEAIGQALNEGLSKVTSTLETAVENLQAAAQSLTEATKGSAPKAKASK